MIIQQEKQRDGFTLIELIVAMVIIGILLGILFPVIGSSIKKGKKNKAEADVKAIVTAWQQYYADYGHWPVEESRFLRNGAPQWAGEAGQASPTAVGIAMTNVVMDCIMFPNASAYTSDHANDADQIDPIVKEYNFKRLQLMERKEWGTQDNDSTMLDPWGQVYRFMLDVNGDGKVEWAPGGGHDVVTVYAPCIAWSVGPDEERDTADDVRSWQ